MISVDSTGEEAAEVEDKTHSEQQKLVELESLQSRSSQLAADIKSLSCWVLKGTGEGRGLVFL